MSFFNSSYLKYEGVNGIRITDEREITREIKPANKVLKSLEVGKIYEITWIDKCKHVAFPLLSIGGGLVFLGTLAYIGLSVAAGAFLRERIVVTLNDVKIMEKPLKILFSSLAICVGLGYCHFRPSYKVVTDKKNVDSFNEALSQAALNNKRT